MVGYNKRIHQAKESLIDNFNEVALTFKEINAFTLEVLGLAILLGGEHPDLVVLVECDIDVNFASVHTLNFKK